MAPRGSGTWKTVQSTLQEDRCRENENAPHAAVKPFVWLPLEGSVPGTGGLMGKAEKPTSAREEAHTSSTMKMKCFQAPSCSPAVSPQSGFPATRGCSRHLCSTTECSRARDTLSSWASPGVWGAVWTSLPPSGVDSDVPLFFLKGSCWQGGDKAALLLEAGSRHQG